MQCRITVKFLHNFFLDPEVFFSSHTMFINDQTKEFTLTHLVTFSISRSRIQMKFYFVYSLIRLWTKCFMNELIVKDKVATCHYIYICSNHVM